MIPQKCPCSIGFMLCLQVDTNRFSFYINLMYFIILLGRAWAAATTEGLMIYSLDSSMVFDPFDLDIKVTPNSTRKALAKGEYSTALILSFKLNEMKLKQEVLEHIPVSSGKCKKQLGILWHHVFLWEHQIHLHCKIYVRIYISQGWNTFHKIKKKTLHAKKWKILKHCMEK